MSIEKIPQVSQPTLERRVQAALYVLEMWPSLPGVKTINTLMYPYKHPPLGPMPLHPDDNHHQGPWILDPEDVRRQAVSLLASVHTALREAALCQPFQQIWTEQANFLRRMCESQPQDEKIPSLREGVLHPPQNVALWLEAHKDHRRKDRQGNPVCN